MVASLGQGGGPVPPTVQGGDVTPWVLACFILHGSGPVQVPVCSTQEAPWCQEAGQAPGASPFSS